MYIFVIQLWLVIALSQYLLGCFIFGMQTRFLLGIDCVDQNHISAGTEMR